jgi:hypothetical protein
MKRIIKLTESDLTRIVRRVLSEGSTVKAKVYGGILNISKNGIDKNGCVKFTKYLKGDNNKWKFKEEWAQGITNVSNNPTADLMIPAEIKFNFSLLINSFIPEGFKKIKFSSQELNDMHNKWVSGQSWDKRIYSKNNTETKDEKIADTKFFIQFGGLKINQFCKTKWG